MNSEKRMLTSKESYDRVKKSLVVRHSKEKNFKIYGQTAIGLAVFFLCFLFYMILSNGIPGFYQHYVTFEVELDRDRIDPRNDLTETSFFEGETKKIVFEGLYSALGNIEGRQERKTARSLISSASDSRLINYLIKNPSEFGNKINFKFALDDDIDTLLRGYIDRKISEDNRRVSNLSLDFVDLLEDEQRITYEISDYLFFGSASRSAEIAGIKGAFVGSILTLLVCILISFPLGIATAVYLEEIAPKNWFTEFIEININNLAAVPSVVFGIMGLAIFIIAFGLPRSIPLVGGIVLALMTLPTIIISSRAAIKSVPASIRDAAYAVGASKMQMIFHHVIPLAMPGMLTGTIIGMAQALGETAPLLMIGMVAFIVDIPGGLREPGTVLPVQIFMWADFAERMFVHKTSAAIIVLLGFLISMNIGAILLRKKLEKRW